MEKNGILNAHIGPRIVGKNFGQFGLNLAKSGQSLEKVSQPRGLHCLNQKI